MNAKTHEAIRRHGETLLAAFPNATEKDPITLCKKLRRIETTAHRGATDYCNGELTSDGWDRLSSRMLARVGGLLGLDAAGLQMAHVFINGDARGYALKLDSDGDWFKDWQANRYKTQQPPLYTDWGGYGILAPDLNQ